LELVFASGSTSRIAKTDLGGNYSIELPSGAWTVNAKSYMRIISGPRNLVVQEGASIIANYTVDIGIRATNQAGSIAVAPTS
jgi:hypothetical protein